jgi:hypothetical protein
MSHGKRGQLYVHGGLERIGRSDRFMLIKCLSEAMNKSVRIDDAVIKIRTGCRIIKSQSPSLCTPHIVTSTVISFTFHICP